ncbi:GNAT family N-acetyltransferase [Heyndrickxia oleronia]|nr:GNAT family N-acetyltransferase [Heyndrickxia oleronia]MEC1374195.1 GNAT family N-acetyltransferase [Heyndrickxia oleronia]QQZ07201.1 GNAT family N-acetyltransferase [Heyndrickxia oleronia]
MEIFIHNRIETITNLLPNWSTLINEYHEVTIFQDISWLASWWEYKIKQIDITPYIIEIKNKDQTIGIFPFYLYKRTLAGMSIYVLKPIGSGESDYLTPVISKKYATEVTLQSVFSRLHEEKKTWDYIDWGEIPENSFLDTVLRKQSYLGKLLFKRKKSDICPFINFTDNSDDFKIKLNKNLMKEIIKKDRRLKKEGKLVFSIVQSDQEIEPIMNTFFTFHCERWSNTDTPSKYRNKEERDYAIRTAKNLFKSNLLHLAYLKYNNEIIAIDFGMTDGKKLYLYLHAINIKYKKYSVGQLLTYYLIEHAFKEGYQIVDFLRGDEDYKKKWGTDENFNVKYMIFNQSIKSKILYTLYKIRHSKTFNQPFILKRISYLATEDK